MYNFVKLKGENTIIEKEEILFDAHYTELPSGIYSIKDMGGMFQRIIAFDPVKSPDNLISFEEGTVKETIDKIREFFTDDVMAAYKEMKISHKLGCILHGPPGTGKTACAQLIMEKLVKDMDAICLVATGRKLEFIKTVVSFLRKKGNSNPICIFVDECEYALVQEENKYLTFLDGADSFEKVIYLGCTNYLDEIPDRIKLRKSRIKHLIEVNRFPDNVYRQYIKTKLPSISADKVAEIAFKAGEANLTIDELKHVLIDWRIEKVDIQTAIDHIISLKSKVKNINTNEDD